jgi:RNA polymerase sigma factor (sigma-70 family)
VAGPQGVGIDSAASFGERLSDEELLALIDADPENGIREILRALGGQLLGRLRRYARDRRYGDAEVEDVFQRALLRLLLPEVRTEIRAAGGGILPWLSRWGYWRLDDLARRQAVGAQKTSAPVDPAVAANPSAAARAVQGVFDQLSPRDRVVLRWRYEERVSNAEVGRRLGIGEGAAKKAGHDARERLRKLLDQSGVRYE